MNTVPNPQAFDRMSPAPQQLAAIERMREAFKECAAAIGVYVPDSADKTQALRLLRTSLMWCNMAITHNDDGSPRA